MNKKTLPEFNILITSVSKKVPLIKHLKKANSKIGNRGKVFGADLNPHCIGRYFTDDFWNMPSISELDIFDLIKYCQCNKIKIIIPTRDGELQYFARYKNLLNKNGINIMISSADAVETCIDKLKFFEAVNKMGFPVINTVTNINQLKGNFFTVKERFGAGAKKIGLKLKKEQAVIYAKRLKDPIFQPYIEGKEMSVDLYVELSGKTKGVVVRTRDLVVNGESQITTTLRNYTLEDLCAKLAEKLNLYGHIIFQVIIDKFDNVHIIECNCRFGGASTVSIEAGLDSFYWFLLESLGIDISNYPFLRSKNEIKQVRFLEDLIIDSGF